MIDDLLSRLQKVRTTGRDSYVACCPSHDDSNPSMTIRVLPDGRILMHCFTGCSTDEILATIGMDFSDLFPEPLSDYIAPVKRKYSPMDILQIINVEAKIVGLAAIDLKNGKPLSEEDHARLLKAIKRIQEGLDNA